MTSSNSQITSMQTVCKPKFVTFTGIDVYTSLEAVEQLSSIYPIEWGVLLSPKHCGGRYPSLDFLRRLTEINGLSLSAHLCGGYARELIEHGHSCLDEVIKAHFQRVQINTADPTIDLKKISSWGAQNDVEVILQCRDGFPGDSRVKWLYDVSGGRGVKPDLWPEACPGVFVGYAGGLNPGNILPLVDVIGRVASTYWLDMETGIRDADDRFDIRKCQAVCEAIWGVRPGCDHPDLLPLKSTTAELLSLASAVESIHGQENPQDRYVRSQAAGVLRLVATRGLGLSSEIGEEQQA